jgi:DNA-binding transcriptional LysR family regulator
MHDKIEWVWKRDLNIQKYMAFVKTVESGSFTKAAQVLGYTQSGISRLINDLETEWGVSFLKECMLVSI